MNLNSIGVIITIYNKEKYLQRAFDSVLNQRSFPDSLYIVNDNSQDSSSAIIHEYMPALKRNIGVVELLDLESNVGAAEARNRALKIATDAYLVFLDADDQYEPDYIFNLRQILSLCPTIGMICSSVRMESNMYIYPSKKMLSTVSSKYGLLIVDNPIKSLSCESLFIGGGNVCFKNVLVNQIRFDPNESNMEEWDFYYRILKKCIVDKLQVVFNPVVGYVYNNLDVNSLSRKKIISNTEIKLPKIISSLKEETEMPYRAFLLSIWNYNTFQRLPNRKEKLIFLRKYYRVLKDMQVNRYAVGAVINFIGDHKLIRFFSDNFKKLWYK